MIPSPANRHETGTLQLEKEQPRGLAVVRSLCLSDRDRMRSESLAAAGALADHAVCFEAVDLAVGEAEEAGENLAAVLA